MAKTLSRLLALIGVLALLLAACGDGGAVPGEQAGSDTTSSEEPEGTAPEGTESEGTAPEGTASEGTALEGEESEGEEPEGEEPEGEESEGEEPEGVAKIGVMVGLTGPFASDAEDVVNAATMAVDDINAEAGVAGYRLEIVEGDTVDLRADAVTSAYERLKAEPNLDFVMTSYASSSNFELEMIAEDGMPYLLSGNAQQTRDIISPDPDAYSTVWSRVPSYDAYETDLPLRLEAWAEEGLLEFRHGRTAFIVSSDDPYGMTIGEGLRESFTDLGWEVIEFETVPMGTVTDWRAILQRIRSNPPDIVVVTDWAPPSTAAFTNQFMENPPNSLLFLQYAPSVPEFTELTGDASTGVIYNNLGAAIETLERSQEIAQQFEERYGYVGGYYAVVAYNQVELYAHCLEQVGDPTDRAAIGECFSGIDTETPSGRLRFDPETHLAVQDDEHFPLVWYQVWDGQLEITYPEQYASAEFRLPPWMED